MAKRIQQFVPTIPARHWEVLEDLVREVVADTNPATVSDTTQTLSTVTTYVHWCWKTAGLPLDRDVLFEFRMIEAFIAARPIPTWSESSYRNHRSKLRQVTRALRGRVASGQPSPIKTNPVEPPYTDSQIVTLRNWAITQSTPQRRFDATVLLALCLGAGLTAGDIADFRGRDVLIDDEGIILRVTGPRPRYVPVLQEWETWLCAAADQTDPDIYLFGRQRTGTSRNFIANFVAKCSPIKPAVSTHRMRATWQVRHLNAGTPLAAFVEAAGIDSLSTITKYLKFLDPIAPQVSRPLLRGLAPEDGDR